LLLCLLERAPGEFGYPHGGWTLSLLREQLEQGTGQGVSEDTIRRELHRLGYAWKRPRYALEPDPEREKKTANSWRDPSAA
jgi:transposase